MTDQERIQIGQWVRDYTAPLLQRAQYLLDDEDEAQDLVQETFLTACDALSRFEGKSSPLTWLTQILRHKVMDRYRKHYRGEGTISLEQYFDGVGNWLDPRVTQPWESASEEELNLDNEDFARTFSQCLEALPPKWKQVIKLYYLAEEETGSICQDLSLSPTYLWKLLQRGRMQLRACLESRWFHA